MEKQTKKLIHFRPLFFSFLILTLAISCARFVFAGKTAYILLVCAVFSLLFFFCVWKKKLLCFLVLLAVFGFGLGWYFVGMTSFQGKTFEGQCQIVARISDDIKFSDYGNRCNVVLKDVKINGEKSKNIYARLNFEDKAEVHIGDVISFTSEVVSVKPFQFERFNSFYYREGVAYTAEISYSQISILKNKLTIDEKIRQKVKSKFSNYENGAIFSAVLFGDKSELSDDVKEAFTNSGVVHLLTVSGLHISFLIALLGLLLKKCRVRGWANLAICTAFVLFYSFLCGWTPSVLRAAVMGLVLTLASSFGKRYDSLNSLGLAGCLVILVRPLFALDLGFLMSYFCVFSIFALFSLFKNLFKKFLPKKVADAVAVSLSAQIGVFPFALQISHSSNLLSVFANLIIVPIFSLLYPLLFVGTLLVLVLPFFAFLLKVCDFGFGVICTLAAFFGETKLVATSEPFDAFTLALGFLLVLVSSRFFMASQKKKVLSCCFLLCMTCASCVLPDFWKKPQAGVSVCYEYSNGVILLTNSAKESVIIDVGSQTFTKRLLEISKVDKVSAVFALQSAQVKIASVREIGCERLIRTGSGEGYGEEHLVGLDEVGRVGNFEFAFRADAGKMVGLEIKFDGMRVFVARERYVTEQNFEKIGQEEFDLVVLGKLDFLSTFEKSAIFASFDRQKGDFSSFERDGNVKYVPKNKNFVRRCLD